MKSLLPVLPLLAVAAILIAACTRNPDSPPAPPVVYTAPHYQVDADVTRPASQPELIVVPDKPGFSRADWGAPQVNVSHTADTWTVAGQKQTLFFDPKTFAMHVSMNSGKTMWSFQPASATDISLRDSEIEFDRPDVREFSFPLTAAKSISIEPYDTGYKTGIKITLSNFPTRISPTLCLTVALEGKNEDLVCDVVGMERGNINIRELNWPPAVDPKNFDAAIISNVRGVLLPSNWPLEYNPIREQRKDASYKYPEENSVSQSNVIEDWSMSWWGYQQGKDAMMCIVETPDDAAQNFSHPAGGPTTLGPRWRASLGKLRYERTCRYIFLPNSNYVAMAKKYRDYVQSTGLFVSLKEKIARNPSVEKLIGTPLTRQGILTDFNTTSLRYSTTQPAKNHHVTTFDDRGEQFKKWKAQGLDKLQIVLTGWPHLGYDRQHPDELPPAPEAGGVEGMKRLEDTCHNLGYLFALHDQYRDYYIDAPSFKTDFAVHEEDDQHTPSVAFPGSRFGQWKEGHIPYMNNWDGGKQSYMNNRMMPGEIAKNYTWLFDHGIHPDGVYLDVFGYVPVDEDFNPEHPTTRTDAFNAHRLAYSWARHNIGFIGTEAGCDWTIPFTDYTSPLTQDKGIPIPLFNLVYHDAVMTPYSPDDLHGLLNAGVPQIGLPRNKDEGGNPSAVGIFQPEYLIATNRMAALHERLALQEMTNHEFLSDDHKIERTTFSDGTTITVDWTKKEATITPDVP